MRLAGQDCIEKGAISKIYDVIPMQTSYHLLCDLEDNIFC